MRENMQQTKLLKTLTLTACFVFLFFFKTASADAATYYASPSGSGTTCSSASPCALNYTINTRAVAGDAVLLKDGIYTGTNYMIVPTKSGTAGNPITIKAENDGKAIIDGQATRIPCDINGKSYIDLEDLKFTNSSGSVVVVHNNASYINIKKTSALNAAPGNYHIFEIASGANHVLVEDSAAYGTARKLFNAFGGTSYVTFRRNWGQWNTFSGATQTFGNCQEFYGNVQNSIIENGVCVKHPNSDKTATAFTINQNGDYGYLTGASNNKLLGNIANNWNGLPAFNHYIAQQVGSNNQYINNVAINYGYFSFTQRGGADLVFNHNSFINNSSQSAATINIANTTEFVKDPGFISSGSFKNSVFMGSTEKGFYISTTPLSNNQCPGNPTCIGAIVADYNAYWDITGSPTYSGAATQGAHDKNETIQPNYDTAAYGNGAYLIKPSNLATSGEGGTYMGAEVLYRYQDGTLTSTPLFPWPMEARICAETGYSVTYENGYAGCANGGGLWKTLDGVYGDTTSPADVNQDTKINIQDIQICVKVITGALTNSRADVNGDGVKNIKDIQQIVKTIAGG
jgi:hypothetical protein